MNVELRIERLVVDGVALPPGGGRAFVAAVETELGRLLGAAGIGPALAGGGAVPSLRGADVRVPADGAPSPVALGRSVAGAVHGGLSR